MVNTKIQQLMETEKLSPGENSWLMEAVEGRFQGSCFYISCDLMLSSLTPS